MSDATSKDDELWLAVLELGNKYPADSSDVREVIQLIKQYGIQERIDELNHLGFDKRLDNPIISCYDEADFGAITVAERLTALKDKENE